jgi:protein-S-isoprenylcysteine O-methyltransferase Ste14
MNILNETLTAVLLLIPVFFLIISSIRTWPEHKKAKDNGNRGKKAAYKKPFYYMLSAGYFLMWIVWIGGIVLSFTSTYPGVLQEITFTASSGGIIQIIGLVLVYTGAVLYNLTLLTAGGLGLVLLSFLFFVPAALILIGLYPTANAEEEVLIDQLGNEYREYQKKRASFFPSSSLTRQYAPNKADSGFCRLQRGG